MQEILCHQCSKTTKFSKQLIGGEVRSCDSGHRGIYDSNLKFIRPAIQPELPKQPPPVPPVPTLINQDYYLPKNNKIKYDGILCFSCQEPTSIIENKSDFKVKCGGCKGSGYQYYGDKDQEFLCSGCDGDGFIVKKGEKRKCVKEHVAIYYKEKFVESCANQ